MSYSCLAQEHDTTDTLLFCSCFWCCYIYFDLILFYLRDVTGGKGIVYLSSSTLHIFPSFHQIVSTQYVR